MIRKIYKNLPKQIKYRFEPFAIRFRRLKKKCLFKAESLSGFPKIIQIETSTFCSGLCLFCPYPSVRAKDRNTLMSVDLFRKAMDECSSYPVGIIYLCLMNDPLTDIRITDLINYAKFKNPEAQVKIITNAQFLSDSLIESLTNSRLDEMRFSIHGWTEDTYKKVVGECFSSALKNVTNFLESVDRRKIDVGMVCVNTKHFTKKDYYAACDFCKRYKIDFALSYACNMAENLDDRSMSNLGLKKKERRMPKGCMDNWPHNSIQILYDGTVVACCMDWRREVILGDASKQTLHQIWNSEIYQDFRDKIYNNKPSPDNFICKRCSESI